MSAILRRKWNFENETMDYDELGDWVEYRDHYNEVARLEREIKYKDSVIDQRNNMLNNAEIKIKHLVIKNSEPCKWEKEYIVMFKPLLDRMPLPPKIKFCPMCGRRLEAK